MVRIVWCGATRVPWQANRYGCALGFPLSRFRLCGHPWDRLARFRSVLRSDYVLCVFTCQELTYHNLEKANVYAGPNILSPPIYADKTGPTESARVPFLGLLARGFMRVKRYRPRGPKGRDRADPKTGLFCTAAYRVRVYPRGP